ncbi:LAP4 [Candida margitis]|uniref:LAP4 n=1 Tax=Candida margitis TaxID=1775924 RepID=UPI0022273B75|nr:LAP4 [Candida margitis]KAI5968026.1 LAP4 [Candida margitis]
MNESFTILNDADSVISITTDDESDTSIGGPILQNSDSAPGISTINSTSSEYTQDSWAIHDNYTTTDTPQVFDFPRSSYTSVQQSREETNYNEIYADEFIKFMIASPTTYHTIVHFKSVLENNGFKGLTQTKPIKDLAPGFYYTSRSDQCLVAFVIGGKWKPENGSCFVGSHCDALSVKLNPRGSMKPRVKGYDLLGVAPYSGSLNKNWLNRDLGLAGAVLVRDSDSGKVTRKLINSHAPVAFIPESAYLVDDTQYNKQTQTVPIFGYSTEEPEPTEDEKRSKFYNRHSLSLLRYISQLSGVPLNSIVDIDLDLVDVQPSCRGGLEREFIYSASLDDRLCAFDSIYGLIEFSRKFFTDAKVEDYDGLSGVYLANNEEIGSLTSTGAFGGLLVDNLRALVSDKCKQAYAEEAIARLIKSTVFLSSDVTHAMNPNFKEVYLQGNYPLLNVGPSIKFDSNAHVLSDSLGKEFLDRVVKNLPGMKLQEFHIRNDSRSGGTIGPIMSDARRGLNGAKLIIDVGMPILSMHSIRSIMGYKDVGIGVRFFKEVFSKWKDVIDGMDA